MQETDFIWQDGRLVAWADAKIHILTHALHYGSAAFEGIRFYKTAEGPAVFRLDEHIERLFSSAEALYMKLSFPHEQIKEAVLETIKANKIDSGYIRPIFYYGYGKMGLSVNGASVNAAIAVWPWGSYLGESPVRVKSSSFYRLCPKAFKMSAKLSGYYVNSIFAGEEARRAGYDEALLTHCDGSITEGPGENFFLAKKGKLYTPPLGMILPGITRDSILKIAKDLKIEAEEKKIRLKDAYGADEAFFTGTAAEVTSIGSIDDKPLKNAPGEITKRLKEAFLRAVRGQDDRYRQWLTFVK